MKSTLYQILILFTLPLATQAQINNCIGAKVVCDNENISLNPQGPGLNDFADFDNFPGCLVDLENNTAWYYFEINENAIPGLSLGFTINPNGGFGEDYDWAVYGPDVFCHNLGFPIRCSSSSAACGFCPQTGMGMGATDLSEGPGSGDGFVMPLIVGPGQGYFLVVDNWQGTQNGFVLTWTGPAANFLNCDAEVPCNIIALAGSDIFSCGSDQPIQLNGTSINNNDEETYSWSGTNGATAFLSDPNIPNPTLQLPSDFNGTVTFTLTVKEDSCMSKDNMSVIISRPDVNINPAGPFCESGNPQTLSASPTGGSWGGAVNSNVFDPKLFGIGSHTITYTYSDNNGCTNTDSIDIEVSNSSGITLTIGDDIIIPLGESTTVEANSNFPLDQIDTVIWSPDNIIDCIDPVCFNVDVLPLNDITLTATVIDLTGCSASDEVRITVNKDRKVYIPTAFSPNNDGINDIFYISTDQKQIALIKKFVVYDRWGTIVHEAVDFLPDDQTRGWDGLYRNEKINPGVFLYLVDVEFIDGVSVTYTGDVSVVR